MKQLIVVSLAVASCTLAVGSAEARNPHCAGGIQYVAQALRDKEKGNIDDYNREIRKAIQQLEMCGAEDPTDFEAMGYLGIAYAEVDSPCAAGKAFARGFEGLNAKGDKKKVEWILSHRDSYWSVAFNDGVFKTTSAQEMSADYCKPTSGGEDEKLKAEATRLYDTAISSLTRARCYKPADVRTLFNLGAVYGLRCQFEKAEAIFAEGLQSAPNDEDLLTGLRAARVNHASALVDDKKYDEAVALYTRVLATAPEDGRLNSGLADVLFKRAQTWSADGLPAERAAALKKAAPSDAELRRVQDVVVDSLRKADFKMAGAAYGKASKAKPDDTDLAFNAALAYQSAGDLASSEIWWQEALKRRPDDPDVLSSLGSVLADQRKFEDAIKTLHRAVVSDPKSKAFHRQLGGAYTKAGNNAKGTEELMVFLALQNGQPVADAAAHAKKAQAGTPAAKTLASMGPPDQIYTWEAEKEKYETWFYWEKRVAFHFKDGTLVVKSDWSSPDLKTAPGAR